MLIPDKNYSFVEENPRNKLTFKKFVKELYYRLMYDEISLISANLSYYFILSFLPMILVILSLTPYFNINQDYILNRIEIVAPGSLGQYIFNMIAEVLNNRNNTILTFSIIFTLWSASNAIYGLMYAFNISFRVKEERMWIITRIISIFLVIIMMLAMFVMLALLVFGRQLTWLLFKKFELDNDFYLVWSYITTVFPLVFTFFIFVILYILATNIKLPFKIAVPGAFFATLAWFAISKVFGYYIDHFSNYIKTYGSIGAIMLFIMWLYFTGYILIIGSEINAILYNYKVENRKFVETYEDVIDYKQE
ncbi:MULTISPECIES: YihY/virulence factor BrkB family protein [unclassified Gemella]|uniref:YihY/virulence factor BrkB family protein n=1 Tax=unclassified Gemella TaxID=2624949 RepID=UPI0010743600|nr:MULTISPECIES: YihY/virulence factor BrkB family protein [unclassified Gemella]MBF0710589.1 YihY/virulence factor BrkB family protein [Gemella sp. GL1.1]MBF0746432.1 YihY/virulence factor BrkB family protein [Gemella sp. 19428wG2_WT2a]NYS27933.1 YihY/virulence factor BrkB family protein [Gemella sp. GL1]TFU60215.1 YihY/virulence factor BrkB family protein [Gemella sp. WT2a]